MTTEADSQISGGLRRPARVVDLVASPINGEEDVYQCPGEAYQISRSVHLGRLASFHPACGGCAHRRDTASFSPRRIKQLSDIQRHAGNMNPLFHAEGIAGIYLNQIGPEIAHRLGQAFGVSLASIAAADVAPRAFIASDGRPWTAELAAVAADGLRWAGCTIVDLGAATAPALALAAHRHGADGSLLVGNPHGKPRELGLTLWGAAGEPLSSPGDLDAVQDLYHSPAPRPQRPFGGSERMAAEADYLGQLAGHYHALRPLRLIVDTTSPALSRYLDRLTSAVTVEIVYGESTAERIRDTRAHFGIWIAGDGECCRVRDERGEPVAIESLVALFAREIESERSRAKIVVTSDVSQPIAPSKPTEFEVIAVASGRHSIWQAMRQHDADLAADGQGRIWFASAAICADALKVLTLLLTLSSRSDRPLSELIASAIL